MPANTNVLLTSSDGSPLLQESQFGQTRLMQFNSRFNPAWNSLTLQPEFPELLLQLLSGNTRETLRFSDARINTVNLPGKTDEPEGSGSPWGGGLQALEDCRDALAAVFDWTLLEDDE